jgi:parallel beta-helix repeat protein
MAGTKLAEFDFSKSPYGTGNLVGQDNWGRVGSNTSGPTQITNGKVILKSGTNNEQTYHPLNAISLISTDLKTYVRIEVNIKDAYRSSGSGTGDYWFGLTANADQSGTLYDRIYLKKTANGLGFTFGLNAGITPQYNDDMIYSFNTLYTLLLIHEPVSGTKNDKVTLFIKPTAGGTEDLVPLITQSFSGVGTYTKNDGSTASLPSAGNAISEPTTLRSLGFWQRSPGAAPNHIEIQKISIGNTLESVDLPPSNPSNAYTPPATFPFIQQPTDEKVVSLQDTSGSIPTLQGMIDGARASNPNSFLLIYLKGAATYPVTTTPLILGSKMCLLGGGATFSASSSSAATSLIYISPGSSFVSISQSILSGGSANLYGIEARGVNRVHLDQVTASQTGKDGIYLQGMGSTIFDNEITITRCQASLASVAGYAGIHIVDATQAVCMDNIASNNFIGILLESSAHCLLFNNQANSNSSAGIVLNNSTWCKVIKNQCSNNAIGLATLGSSNDKQYNFFVGNEVEGTATGFSLGGAANILYRNTISSNLSNRIATTGAGIQRIYSTDTAYVLNSNQEYFYPPTAFNQHSDLIISGKNRTDVTTAATTLSAIKNEYDAACVANPDNVIVLHLTAPQITGDTTITLNPNTSVILDGTINLNSGVTAFTATASTNICLSGGMILGGNTTGRPGLSFANCSRIIIENMSFYDFGDKNLRVEGSDVIAFDGCGTPCMVTACLINGGAARGIWTKGNTISSTAGFILSENWISKVNMDGIDFDITTASSLAMDNTCSDNIRYGIFTEEGANLNHVVRNVCANNAIGINVYSNDNLNTVRNTFIGNTCTGNQRGIRFGALIPWETSQNFAFNNQIYGSSSSGIDSQGRGSANYLSQNLFSGNVANLGSTTSAVFFNPPVVSPTLALTYADWQSRYFWYGADSSLTADPNQNGSTNLMEYALGQNPLARGSLSSQPVFDFSASEVSPASYTITLPRWNETIPINIGGVLWPALTYRHNKIATDLTYEIWSSTDLANWTLQNTDGVNVIEETINSNVDGDGTIELLRTRIKPGSDETKRFLKLQVRKN